MSIPIVDYSTPAAKVRLLISDIDLTSPIFNDEAIAAFLEINGDSVKRAAASALLVIAANEVLVQKRIRLLDLATDGPAEAEALRKLAAQYRDEAEYEDTDGAFGWAEIVQTPAQYDEYFYKQLLRA
jgi:hypothetical protein